MTTTLLDVGDTAPAFTLPTDGDGTFSLSFPRDKAVALYFYPKDSTPGCTTEAQDFRDMKDDFATLEVEVVGVSKDSVKSHDTFKAKQELNFTLISDAEGTCCEAYGVWVMKKNYGREYMGIERATFLIGKDGKIVQIWRKVRVKGHVEAVLEAAKGLGSAA
ncbi:MAG: thioredoxin-dependent thiol peroxidase [Rhodospirillum sp.]|nr:thioredoxin-dependent thiol peroxidase [Rhodospirillum sp.]MCF8490595.1 thioredoxin-dependent thiol peroxidase [Rhodospirillum sp.]MCF8498958.1 thioredoxin-dependent thiol peroxidase [Rhodospirillum sp.]